MCKRRANWQPIGIHTQAQDSKKRTWGTQYKIMVVCYRCHFSTRLLIYLCPGASKAERIRNSTKVQANNTWRENDRFLKRSQTNSSKVYLQQTYPIYLVTSYYSTLCVTQARKWDEIYQECGKTKRQIPACHPVYY